jgi:hypothetical protein
MYGPPAQKRYYDRNIRDADNVKLRYLHRNPVVRGLAKTPAGWKWSSFRHYALREKGPVEIESQWTATDRGWIAAHLPEPRLASTKRTRTWGTRRSDQWLAADCVVSGNCFRALAMT